MKHDADCKCLADEERLRECRTWGSAASDEAMREPDCRCKCDACGKRRATLLKMIDLAKIEARLTKANIAPAQLATLLWAHVTDGLEEWIKRLAKEALVAHISEMKLTTRVYLDPANMTFGKESK